MTFQNANGGRRLRKLGSTLAALACVTLTAACSAPEAATNTSRSERIATLASEARFDFQQDRLANGLTVVTIPDHRAPVVLHMVLYPYGAADEPEGKSGIAHLLEHLMFKGTKTMGPKDFSAIVARLGGNENAFTSADYTGYFQQIAATHLERMMGLEADRMVNLTLTDEDVLPERDVVLEERRMRVETRPGPKLGIEMQTALFGDHIYGIPIIGWKDEIAALTRQDALDFYDKHYGPDHAVLIVAGDATHEDVMAMAQRTYGQIAPRNTAKPALMEKQVQAPHRQTVRYSDHFVARNSLRLQCIAPTLPTDPEDDAGLRDAIALDMVEQILDGGRTGRFYKALIEGDALATSFYAYADTVARGPGQFYVGATATPGTDLTTLEAAIWSILNDLADNGVTPDELDRAKIRYLTGFIYARDSVGSIARFATRLMSTGLTLDIANKLPETVQLVTPDDVQRAAKLVLQQAPCVVGHLEVPAK